MNGFEQHGIDHLSPSSINLWINAPDVWVAEKLFGKRGAASPAMARGIVVESAVESVLSGGSVTDAAKAAEEEFDRRIFMGDERSEAERAAIAPMIEQAADALADLGPPEPADNDRGQHKIELQCRMDGWSIPFIGFLDFLWPARGLVIDLKTTMRCPSVMTVEHQVQRCIYAKAQGNRDVKFLYVTPKKTALLSDGDVNETLARVKAHVARMERMLHSRSKEEIAAIIPVNERSFYWSGNDDARREIYGL